MKDIFNVCRKAFVAAAGAAVTAYFGYRSGGVTAEEWGQIAGSAVATGLGVWGIRNKDKKRENNAEVR